MKAPALQRLREKLQADEPVYGMGVTLEAAAVSDIAAGLGMDWIAIDADRSHLDWAEVHEHVRATVRSNTVALVRIAKADPELVERALGLGADGVLVANIENAAMLRSVVRWSRQAAPAADAFIAPVLSANAAATVIRELALVDGADVLFFPPVQPVTLQAGPSRAPAAAGQQDMLVRHLRNQGKQAGVITPGEQMLADFRGRGFRMLGVGSDAGIIRGGLRAMLDVVNGLAGPKEARA